MSGTSYEQDCPRCKGKDTLQMVSDWKPFESSAGECVKCGFYIRTILGLLNLKELKEIRKIYETDTKIEKDDSKFKDFDENYEIKREK